MIGIVNVRRCPRPSRVTGVVLPFPRFRDRAYVHRHALRMATSPSTAEKYIAAQLQVQRATMIRRGVGPSLVVDHLSALEIALRAEAYRLSGMLGDAE
jgi:hypothetical protein